MSVELDLHFDPQGDTLAAARECEATVFLHQYGNTATQWAEEYGPYEPSSTFITITERGGDALATMRLIVPSEAGLKSLADVARPPWSIDGVRVGPRGRHGRGPDMGRRDDRHPQARRPPHPALGRACTTHCSGQRARTTSAGS